MERQRNPFEDYEISDMDESGTTKYYGFVDYSGRWKMMANDTTTGSYRYARGDSAYTTAWTNRAALTYGYYYNVF